MNTFDYLEAIESVRERHSLPWKAIKVMVLAHQRNNAGVALSELQERSWKDVLGVDYELCGLWRFSHEGVKRQGSYRKLLKLTGRGLRVTKQLMID